MKTSISTEKLKECIQILEKKEKFPNLIKLRLAEQENILKETLLNIEHLGNIFECKKAFGYPLDHDGVFVVLKGSIAKFDRDLLEKGVLKKEGDAYIFTRDYAFNKPSPAAKAVLGFSADGYNAWKSLQKTTLRELTGRE